MIVYSKKIVLFLNEIKSTIKSVLTHEVGLKVHGDRFYDKQQRYSFPIKVVIFNNKRRLGYFDPDFYELGFNECMMHVGTAQLHALIRHELAHYITFCTKGTEPHPHGSNFRAFCQQMGWGAEVYQAATYLEAGQQLPEEESSSVLRKVQKLLALANSRNQHEAEQAMIKSQQLLLNHNIESKYIGTESGEKVFLKRIMKQKKEDAKMRAIARILETFFVNVVYSRGGDYTYLEILGNSVNIEIAEHVAKVLQVELDKLWQQAQRQSMLKGTVAKNSFFLGLARGYCAKIGALQKAYASDVTHALMVIEKQLVDARTMAYPRLSKGKSRGSYCQASSLVGEQMGRQLTINPALNKSKNANALLTHDKVSP